MATDQGVSLGGGELNEARDPKRRIFLDHVLALISWPSVV